MVSQTFNILIQVSNPNVSESIISLFRTAQINTRAHRITSEQDLSEHLRDDTWDLLIADNQHPEVTLTSCLKNIEENNLHLPVILYTDDCSDSVVKQALKLGIADVIDKQNTSAFLLAAKREMINSQKLHQLEELQQSYNELRSRAELLMQETTDGIAYIEGGIIMHSNQIFADMFGYDDGEELDFASIIDLVDEKDHDAFKNFIKQPESNDSFSFNGLKANGETFASTMRIDEAQYDGEPCIQVTIGSANEQSSAGSTGGSGTIDNASELYNRYYLEQFVHQLGTNQSASSLALLSIDSNETLQKTPLSGIDAVIKTLGEKLNENLGAQATIARLGNEYIAIACNKSAEQTMEMIKPQLAALADHIFELPNKTTVQITCSGAIVAINVKDSLFVIDQALLGLEQCALESKKDHIIIYEPDATLSNAKKISESSDISEAIENKVFELLYQPIMSLQGNTFENYEATVWITDPEGNQIYPEDMINSANNSKLDRWIILESTKALAAHQANGHNSRLMINLTINALSDEGLSKWLGVALKAANLKQEAVIFQFREEDVHKNLKSAIATIGNMQAAGYAVSITDFGKMDDPFKICSHINFNLAKLNGEFTANMAKDSEPLKAIVSKAKEQEMESIIPDVDNAGALATLWQVGAHYIQGSYLQLPSPKMNYEFTDIG